MERLETIMLNNWDRPSSRDGSVDRHCISRSLTKHSCCFSSQPKTPVVAQEAHATLQVDFYHFYLNLVDWSSPGNLRVPVERLHQPGGVQFLE